MKLYRCDRCKKEVPFLIDIILKNKEILSVCKICYKILKKRLDNLK